MNLHPPKPASKGFALIVTLSLMILLTVIAVGLLTLSSISLRTSSQSTEMAAARSNARLALMLAIGELQKTAGLDTRITARADVLKDTNPPVLGVWKSWEGKDHELTGGAMGRPISVGNDYKAKKEERFLCWLVSGVDPAAATTLPDTAKGINKAILLGDLSVGSGPLREKLQIHLTPTKVNLATQQGSFAWWVSGENQKARLPNPYRPSAEAAGRWAINAKSHSTADPKMFRMDSLLTDATPAAKAITLKQSDLFSAATTLPTSQEFFHDLSTSAVGLLTNVATGGWKKDLSLFTEGLLAVAGGATNPGTSNLPLFRVKPGQDILYTIPTNANPVPAKSILYPWASYRGDPSREAIYQHGPVSSWENLKDYALAYRRISTSGTTGRSTISTSSFPIDDGLPVASAPFNFLHKVRILPVIARLQWVFSYTATLLPAGTYEPRLLLTPVLTMWNPYNVEITSGPLNFKIGKPLPAALKFTVNGGSNTNYNRVISDYLPNGPINNLNNIPPLSTEGSMNYEIKVNFTLKPGETRLFSPVAGGLVTADKILELKPGYNTGGGHYFTVKNDLGVNLTAPGTATMKADVKFDTIYGDSGPPGVGIYLDMMIGGPNGQRHLAYRMVYTPTVAAAVYRKELKGATSDPLTKIAGTPSPFMTTVFGARMASKTHIAAKGFVQSSPLVNYTAMGGKDLAESTIARHYAGTNHPVNSPFDYSFEALAAGGDSLTPESDSLNHGFIVTGFGKGDGLYRCVISELPTRPLQSLAELQNWDLRYENPVPPFAFNLIGNSDATPLIAANSVIGDYSDSVNLQHDDSHCANHLLFDDWFFSSIAPDPTTFGVVGKNLKAAYTEFVTGVAPLANRAYKALSQDTSFAAISGNAAALYSTHVFKADSWKKVASRLEVEGMFNVNSTSVTAWRALLGHARNQKVPYIKDTSGSWSIDVSGESDYAFSRFAVAGDSEAKSAGTSGTWGGAAEYSGYRILDEKTLDALAAELVKQVRLRGPFLSLSEFINRQLSSDKTLAIAGAVQAALDQIAKNSATNPYQEITKVPRPASAVPAAVPDQAEYKFSEAAVGQATYGVPGWTRQADVLRALAPILTARDDTFTIRAYGDVRDGKGTIKARATCEAIVRRTREYVDPGDLAEITTLPTKPANTTFGRRFQIVSYRWLSPSEI